jgi:hypothetical protein
MKEKVIFKFKNKYTLEEIETELDIKLTYPNQFVEGDVDEERYKKLVNFGCSDIWDKKAHWMHRDCFIGRNPGVCEQCNFFPVKQQYQLKEGIDNNPEIDDLFKAMSFDISPDIE